MLALPSCRGEPAIAPDSPAPPVGDSGAADSGELDAPAAGAHAINWKPGHRIFIGGVGDLGGKTLAAALARMDAIVALDTSHVVLGFEIMPHWSKLEGGTAGDYSAGFAAVDQLVARAQSYDPPRDLSITMYASSPSGGTTFPSLAPAYLDSTAYGTVDGVHDFGGAYSNSNPDVSIVRFWNLAVADRLVALMQAYAQRYGAALYRFDPFAEISEDARTGYTDATLIATLQTMAPAARAACPHLLIMIRPTYLTDTGLYEQLLAAVLPAYWSVGDFDGIPEPPNGKYVGADLAYRGIQLVYPDSAQPRPDWTNYVGKGDFWVCPNEDELGPASDAMTLPAQEGSGVLGDIFGHVMQQGASHVVWGDNTYTGPNSNRTTTTPAGVHPNLIDFISANPVTNTAYPQGWP